MSVHRGMVELKTLAKRIQKEIQSAKFVAFRKKNTKAAWRQSPSIFTINCWKTA